MRRRHVITRSRPAATTRPAVDIDTKNLPVFASGAQAVDEFGQGVRQPVE